MLTLNYIEETYGEIKAISLPHLKDFELNLVINSGLYFKGINKDFNLIIHKINYYLSYDLYHPFCIWTDNYIIWNLNNDYDDNISNLISIPILPTHIY